MVKNGKKENGEKTMLLNETGLVENTATEGMQKRKKEESEEEERKDKYSRHLKNEGSVERKSSIEKANEEKRKREKEQQKRIVEDIKDRMLSKDLMTTYQTRMAKKFITLARLSSRDEEEDISDILEEFHNKFPKDHEYITEDDLCEFLKLDEQDAELLYAKLQGGHPWARVSYETFEKWMMEVKRINILTTTFLKISGGEEVIFPNSILGTKPLFTSRESQIQMTTLN